MAIKIAADSNIIIDLSKFMDPKFDPNNTVHELIKSGSDKLTATFKNIPKKFLPPLLQDNYLGELILSNDGNWHYQRLMNISKLAYSLERKSIELCITPLVVLETYKTKTASFIDTYCTKLKVSEKFAPEFYNLRGELAAEYTSGGGMEQVLDGRRLKMQPSNDAYIMAEASLFGLNLITANERHFIHDDIYKQDYNKANKINNINKENGLVYISNHEGRPFIPGPMTLSSTVSRIKKYIKDENFAGMIYATNSNIDENNEYFTI